MRERVVSPGAFLRQLLNLIKQQAHSMMVFFSGDQLDAAVHIDAERPHRVDGLEDVIVVDPSGKDHRMELLEFQGGSKVGQDARAPVFCVACPLEKGCRDGILLCPFSVSAVGPWPALATR